jgi:hypothetical protein
MKITKDVIETIKKSSNDILEDISEKESWSIEKTSSIESNWNKIIKNIDELAKEKNVNDLFLKLFAYLNTGDMVAFAMELNSHDSKIFKDFLLKIENISGNEKEELVSFFKEKIMVVYRINTIPKIFSENRVSALRMALNKI